MWFSNARLIDGTGATEVGTVDLRIKDDRIVEITPAAPRPCAIDLIARAMRPARSC